VTGILQDKLLEFSDLIESFFGRNLPRDGFVELFLLLGQQLEEFGDVPDIPLPIEHLDMRLVPGAKVVIFRIGHDTHQPGLAAISDEGLLRVRVQPPFHDVERFLDHRIVVPGGEDEGLAADIAGAIDRPVFFAQPWCRTKG